MIKLMSRQAVPIAAKVLPTSLIQRFFGNFVPVFMLHRFTHPDYGITGHNPDDIKANLEYFTKHGYQAISLEELGRHISAGTHIPFKSAIFTIDDGFIDHHDIAGPLFARYDIPLTYFLVTEFIDEKLWPWDDHLTYLFEHAAIGTYTIPIGRKFYDIELEDIISRSSARKQIIELLKNSDNTRLYDDIDELYALMHVEKPITAPDLYKPMTWEQANDLVRKGHHMAAHTCTHRILSMLNDEMSTDEITRSIRTVRTKITFPSPVFAYPSGRSSDFGDREIGCLDRQDILATVSTAARSFAQKNVYSTHERHSIPRFPMPSSKIDFIQYLCWIEYLKNWARKARAHF